VLLLLGDGTQVAVPELPGDGPGWAGIAPDAPPR
jgi:hypothetical protein